MPINQNGRTIINIKEDAFVDLKYFIFGEKPRSLHKIILILIISKLYQIQQFYKELTG